MDKLSEKDRTAIVLGQFSFGPKEQRGFLLVLLGESEGKLARLWMIKMAMATSPIYPSIRNFELEPGAAVWLNRAPFCAGLRW